jgi:hypothetical protein
MIGHEARLRIALAGLAGLAGLIAGCGAARSRVRDLDGRPVPLYSVGAYGPVEPVRCADGHEYLVLTDPPPPFLRGASFGSVLRFAAPDISTVCNRILASW